MKIMGEKINHTAVLQNFVKKKIKHYIHWNHAFCYIPERNLAWKPIGTRFGLCVNLLCMLYEVVYYVFVMRAILSSLFINAL